MRQAIQRSWMPCGSEAMLYHGVLPIARPERSFEREMGPTACSVAAGWRDSAHGYGEPVTAGDIKALRKITNDALPKDKSVGKQSLF